MTSAFAWLDHSEEQRRQILDVLDLFREKSTIDELGLGTIRDAFADMLFPGTSAPQTKARYFLFIPWIYLGLEGNPFAPVKSRSVSLCVIADPSIGNRALKRGAG